MLLQLRKIWPAYMFRIQNLHSLLWKSQHLRPNNLKTLSRDISHYFTSLEVCIRFDQNEWFLFSDHIDLFGHLVAEFLNFVFSAINLNLIAHIEQRLVYLLVSDSSQVDFPRLEVNNLNTLINGVVNEFVRAFWGCHLIIPTQFEWHRVILCWHHL